MRCRKLGGADARQLLNGMDRVHKVKISPRRHHVPRHDDTDWWMIVVGRPRNHVSPRSIIRHSFFGSRFLETAIDQTPIMASRFAGFQFVAALEPYRTVLQEG